MTVNVYGSGSLKERKEVWDEISEFRKIQQNRVWCVVGDFNSIRRKEEKKSVVSVSNCSRETRGFNSFMENSELFDIPMIGIKFTWYTANETIKSRIDRILVSREWVEVWPNSKQFVLTRSVFDHCALVLKVSSVDWGPKPLRSLDVWQRDGRF